MKGLKINDLYAIQGNHISKAHYQVSDTLKVADTCNLYFFFNRSIQRNKQALTAVPALK